MKKIQIREILRFVFIGKRYSEFTAIEDQIRYLTINFIFMAAIIPLVILGYTMVGINNPRAAIDFGFALLLVVSIVLMRSKIPFKVIPPVMVSLFGLYCLYLVYLGTLGLWVSVWVFSFPVIALFLCKMLVGTIQSSILISATAILFYGNLTRLHIIREIRIRYIAGYILIFAIAIIYERISILKDKKETELKAQLSRERDIIETMKDNLHQGIFLMDGELRILPQYSKPLITILSHYDSDLTGTSFLDILRTSLDTRQLATMKGYFEMIFSKSKSAKVLESVNPISEFEYKVDQRVKTLSTRFRLVEQADSEPVIIGIIQDITREKEWEKEFQAQKQAQEQEMKNLFDVIQIDPLVFRDFIDDMESNFNYINAILKDKTLTEKQVVTKFFQNIHAIKSNALILGLETFGNKFHALEDDIKAVSAKEDIQVDDILSLAIKLETLMQEKDTYTAIIDKVEAFKASNQVDSVLVHSLTKAVEKISAETRKKVDLKTGLLDMDILQSKLRRPIKDILFQCVRNSIYHGIEPTDDRIRKQKKPEGLLVFSVKKIDGKAEITFSDDGSGLDWGKIRKKYLENHPGAAAITKKTLLASIFSPEFSTADSAGTLAGRGVGLSLVKDLVKENKGTIQVDSSDMGLLFKFTFPLAG